MFLKLISRAPALCSHEVGANRCQIALKSHDAHVPYTEIVQSTLRYEHIGLATRRVWNKVYHRRQIDPYRRTMCEQRRTQSARDMAYVQCRQSGSSSSSSSSRREVDDALCIHFQQFLHRKHGSSLIIFSASVSGH